MLERIVTILNPAGIHARPSASIVKIASKYQNNITLYANNSKANAKSIIEVMMLAMPEGTEVKVTVDGNSAEQVLDDMCNGLTGIYEYD